MLPINLLVETHMVSISNPMSLCSQVIKFKRVSENLTCDLWPWGQGHWDSNSSKVSTFTNDDFLLKSFTRISENLTFDLDFEMEVSQIQTCLRFLVATCTLTNIGVHIARLPTQQGNNNTPSTFYSWGVITCFFHCKCPSNHKKSSFFHCLTQSFLLVGSQ